MKFSIILLLLIVATACSNVTHFKVRAKCESSKALMDSVNAFLQTKVMRIEAKKAKDTIRAFSNRFENSQRFEYAWEIFRSSDDEIVYECCETWSYKYNASRIGQPEHIVHVVRTKYLIDENAEEECYVYWDLRNFLKRHCSNFEVFEIEDD